MAFKTSSNTVALALNLVPFAGNPKPLLPHKSWLAREVAQRIAGHAHSRTTKLYDRLGQKVLVEDMERIHYLNWL